MVRTDSQYCMDILQGISHPTTHVQLITLLTQYWKVLKVISSIQVKKVAAHTGVEGNERADRNADMGARHLLTYEGRHSLVPPAPLRPPPNPNSTTWVSQFSPTQQNTMLTKALDHASSATLTPRPPSLRKKHITARTWEKYRSYNLSQQILQ